MYKEDCLPQNAKEGTIFMLIISLISVVRYRNPDIKINSVSKIEANKVSQGNL